MGAAYGRYRWPFKLDQVGSRGMVQKGGSSAYLVANAPRDEAGPHVEHWTNCQRHLRVNPTDPAVVVQFEIYFTRYNFVRIHQTLKITPAMAAGVTTKLWEMSDMMKVLEDWEGAN